MSNRERPRIAIIGAGMTGLAAAHHLQAIDPGGVRWRVTLIDANPRVGGKVRTLRHDGYVIEAGPDSFAAQDPVLRPLIRAVGLEPQLVEARTTRVFVFQDERLQPYPAGSVLGVPTRIVPLLRTPLVSMTAKVRVLWDLFRRCELIGVDESIGGFLDRRLGHEVVERLVEPLLGGIHGDRLEHLSLRETAPYFLRLRGSRRSLILALRRQHRAAQRACRHTGTQENPSPVLSLRNGLQTLVDRLATSLSATTLRLGIAARGVEHREGRYRIHLEGDQAVDADAVILAVPSREAARLLGVGPEFGPLGWDPCRSLAIATLAFPEALFTLPWRGSGFVVPERSGLTLAACTWSHAKWKHVAPRGRVLLRCHVGGVGGDALVAASDRALVAAVRRDLGRVFGVSNPPDFYHVTRWAEAMPGYRVGHAGNVAMARGVTAERFPGIALAGAAYGGVSLGACARQGQEAAAAALEFLSSRAECRMALAPERAA